MQNQYTSTTRFGSLYALKYLSRSVIFTFFIFTTFAAKAQLQANFTADTTQGCSPIVVSFQDLSTGNPVSWKWDFGNGNSSTIQNPSATYPKPGTYSVTLTVKDASGNSSSKSINITVFPTPNVSFTESATTGCYPLTITFTDQSSSGSGNITNWLWDFGNGDTSSAQNPVYTYYKSGTYNVQLVVTNSAGCVSAAGSPKPITIPNGIQPSFSSADTFACKAPFTSIFNNTTTGPGTLSYFWNFGDGQTSTDQNPTHYYNQPGSYGVTLIATSSSGCADTLQKNKYINIANFQPSIGMPGPICEASPVTFTNTSNPAPAGNTWSFSDGTMYTSSDVTKSFSAGNGYTVRLINTFPGGCRDSVTQNFSVAAKPTAGFTADKTSSCSAPSTINFTDQSANAIAWRWDFGDGQISTAQNPSHTYNSLGDYTVKLVVTNKSGCQDSVIKTNYIQILQPSVNITANNIMGCVPLNVSFNTAVNSIDSITSYTWDFGDGQTGTGPNPSHTYTTQGTYTVKLTITTAGGCSKTIQYGNPILAGNHPNVQFSANPTDACAQINVQFTDQSSAGNQWQWFFGDGTTSNLENPAHQYGDTGLFNVTLVVTNVGCIDTLTKLKYVHISPPIAAFGENRDCSNPYFIQFVDKSIGATQYTWDFGDDSISTVANPSHTYADTGTYNVILTVSNGTCTYTTNKTYHIIDEHPNFTIAQDTICRNNTETLTATNINPSNIKNYLWQFSGGVPAVNSITPVISTVFNNPGVYNVTLITTDLNGCQDTVIKDSAITVTGPTANFSVNTPQACEGVNVNFTDLSTIDGNPITKWIWNYGDGNTDTLTAAPFSHTYQQTGSFNVQLTVMDSGGCKNSIVKNAAISVATTKADFYSPDTLSCPGQQIKFLNQSTGSPTTTQWDFGDGQTSNSSSPTHIYSQDSLYTIKLSVANSYGCQDSLTKVEYIKIATPKAAFSINNLSDSETVACPPFVASFTNNSVNYKQLTWYFGDGSVSTVANPSHVYNYPGTYTVKLVIVSNGGCEDSASHSFTINGPVGLITFQPTVACSLPVNITFSASSKNAISYQWDFGDGTVSNPTSDSIVTHTYQQRGDYKPVLIVADANGCKVPYNGEDSLIVDQLEAKFIANKYTVCDSGFVSLTDSTHSFSADTLGLPNTYHWDFGIPGRTDDTSNQKNPVFYYKTPGNYIITETVTTYFGCQQSVEDSIKVVGRSKISIAGPNAGCANSPFTFTGNQTGGSGSVNIWKWNFGNGDTTSLQDPPAENYTVAGNYNVQLIGINTDGCADTAIHPLIIHPIPIVNATAAQNNICLGQKVQLTAHDGAAYSWTPFAGLDNPSAADPVASPIQSTTYYVNVTNAFGCSSSDSVHINVSQPFSISATGDTTICAGQQVQLSVSGGAVKYSWSPGIYLNNTTINNPVSNPDSSVTYQVIGYGDDACFTDTAYVHLNVVPLPQVNAGPDQTVTVGSVVNLQATASSDVISYQWKPANWLSCTNCSNPVSTPRGNVDYTVTVANENGCTSSDDVKINLVCSEGVVFIPNTFTPNGDNQNDIFYPRGRGIQIVKDFKIFNRWGQLVFERSNFNLNDKENGWDGTFNGEKLPPDVFVYVTDMVCDNGQPFQLKGNVTLLR